jgi:HK97 gp10 family phage protein
VATRVRVNQGALNQIFRSPSGPVGNRLHSLGIMAANNARSSAPVDTGRLRASIQVTSPQGSPLTVRIGSNVNYAIFVEQGTRFMDARPFLSTAVGR